MTHSATRSVLFIAAMLFTSQLEAKRPNIIFIFTDDHASHAIGAYGSKINKTPHIDRLAREGTLFQNAFCTNSICGPSRAVIQTGKHSHLNGFRTNGDRFNGDQQTFPKLLRKAGYQTAVIGKWHLVTEPQGFDKWSVLIGQGPYYNPPMRTPEGTVKYTGYTTDIITDLALDWLAKDRDQEKPFCLMLQQKAPHRNWQPGPKHLNLYDDVEIPEPATLFDDWSGRTSATKTQTMTVAEHLTPNDLKLTQPRNFTAEQLAVWNRAYAPKNQAFREAKLEGKELVRWKYQRYIKDYLRCIASVDDNIGRVLDYLDKSKLAENTIVIYSSDQGFYLGDHGWYDKRWMYEESLRMPLIARWPGHTKPGTINSDLVQNLDFAQTFLDIAGVEQPSDMQGRSLVPLLEGKTPKDWRQSIYYHYYEFPGAHMVRRHYGVRTARHKLIKYYEIDEWELFDLEKDPDELKSVHSDPAYAEVREKLEAELVRLQALYADTKPEESLNAAGQRAIRKQAAKTELARAFRQASIDDTLHRGLDPSKKTFTVGAHCTLRGKGGVVLAHGGASYGWALWVKDGVPRFSVRDGGHLKTVTAPTALKAGSRAFLAGMVDGRGRLRLVVDGEQTVEKQGLFVSRNPADGLSLGRDSGSLVGDYGEDNAFEGEVEDLRIYWGVVRKKQLRSWSNGEDVQLEGVPSKGE